MIARVRRYDTAALSDDAAHPSHRVRAMMFVKSAVLALAFAAGAACSGPNQPSSPPTSSSAGERSTAQPAEGMPSPGDAGGAVPDPPTDEPGALRYERRVDVAEAPHDGGVDAGAAATDASRTR